MGSWHVRFDGQPELMGHVCAAHRSFGLALNCSDGRPGHDCAHVQTSRCDCDAMPACDACEREQESA